MTMVDDAPSEELMGIARTLMGGQGKASMKVIYARRPFKDTATGKAISMPGWITWIDDDTRTGALWEKVARGWQPLKQFGTLGQRDGSPDALGPWQKILEHRDGPGLFPVDQLMEFGWYDRDRVPVQGVNFPQLKGMKIPQYPCPECSDRTFLKPIHLARHCRNAHSYDRKDIQDMAEQLGIDLVREMYGNRQKVQVYDYTEADAQPEPIVPPDYEVETVAVRPRSAATEKAMVNGPRGSQAATAKRPPRTEAQKQVLRDRLAVARQRKQAKATT